MSTKPFRLIIDPPQAGAWNMAVDEALLDAAADDGVATLRFYRWSEPTLSLGYFQAYDERAAHAASRECRCVRRHSGGGAILHDRELTYSLALPAERLPAGGPLALYDLAHAGLIRVLDGLLPGAGERLSLCGPGRTKPAPEEPFLCFQRRSEGDVLVASDDRDDKVIGSAQRKRRGAVLQHGSVLLERSPWAPELPGLAELLTTAAPPFTDFAERLSVEFAELLATEIEPASLSPGQNAVAEAYLTQRFDSPAWTRRR